MMVPALEQICREARAQGGPQSEWWWCMDESLALILERLATHRYVILDDLLEDEEANFLLEEVQNANEEGMIAGDGIVGGGNDGNLIDSNVDKAIRGDKLAYFDGTESNWPGPTLSKVLQKLNTLIVELGGMSGNEDLNQVQNELKSIKTRSRAMITCYPPGGYYATHVDNPCGNGRRITFILYLNPEWKAEDGASLRIHPPMIIPSSSHWQSSYNHITETVEIEPIFNRLILFFSDHRCPHEVTPSYRDRFALTVWFIDSVERQQLQDLKARQQGIQEGHDHTELYVVKQEICEEGNVCYLYIEFLKDPVHMGNLILDVDDKKCLIAIKDVPGYEMVGGGGDSNNNTIEVTFPFRIDRRQTNASFKKKLNRLQISVTRGSKE